MRTTLIFVATLAVTLFATPSLAAEYKCASNRIEKSGSTYGSYKSSGSDWSIEKGSSTVGYAKKQGSDWRIENSGSSTIGYFRAGSRIESSGSSSLGVLRDAQRFAKGCPSEVAVALWLLKREGKL